MMRDTDFFQVLVVHHFEFGVPLALFALSVKALVGQWSVRIMPIFFGFTLAPLVGVMVLAWPRWREPLPVYILTGDAFTPNFSVWPMLYFPFWSACALLALLHPILSKQLSARILLWALASALLLTQAYLVLTSTELR